jgi:LmbE family N-acetylglucosaminyl deacetylase
MKGNAELRSPVSFKSKKLLVIAPHPDDDAIGCGAFLLHIADQADIHIVYAVSGFNGVTNRFLTDTEKVQPMILGVLSDRELWEIKAGVRQQEALACCKYLGATPHFWNLPFYEKRKKKFSQKDVEIAERALRQINPDIVILIDEESDPHGTHGFVKQICLKAIKNIKFDGTILGYRVWDEGYSSEECYTTIFFDDALTQEKSNLIRLYRSQIQDPAFAHEHHSFVDLAKKCNEKQAQRLGSDFKYAECFSLLRA